MHLAKVYSTCSLNPIEDEAVVAAALRRHGASVAQLGICKFEALHPLRFESYA